MCAEKVESEGEGEGDGVDIIIDICFSKYSTTVLYSAKQGESIQGKGEKGGMLPSVLKCPECLKIAVPFPREKTG